MDTWTSVTTNNAPPARIGHTAVWTGYEMIVWGGVTNYVAPFSIPGPLEAGGRYNPASDSWVRLTNAIFGSVGTAGIWTGNELILSGVTAAIWPGSLGLRYNPTGNYYTPLGTNGSPSLRAGHSAVWTGNEMIVWGGVGTNALNLSTGGIYNPATDSWRSTTTTGAPAARNSHSAVWTGSQMLIWGGSGGDGVPFSYTPARSLYLYQRP